MFVSNHETVRIRPEYKIWKKRNSTCNYSKIQILRLKVCSDVCVLRSVMQHVKDSVLPRSASLPNAARHLV